MSKEPIVTDPTICGYGSRPVSDGDVLSAVRGAYNDAIQRVSDRKAVMVEVHIRVAPKES